MYYVEQRVIKITVIVNFGDRYILLQISQLFSTVKFVKVIEFNSLINQYESFKVSSNYKEDGTNASRELGIYYTFFIFLHLRAFHKYVNIHQ